MGLRKEREGKRKNSPRNWFCGIQEKKKGK
jgi:hypothetical protein